MSEKQKSLIVEMARIAEMALNWAAKFDPADTVRFNSRYTARWASDEAFRVAREAQP